MSRTIVLLLSLATWGILSEAADAQCWRVRYRVVPAYTVQPCYTPVTVVYSRGYGGCCSGRYYSYPYYGYAYYGSSCCLPAQPWPTTVTPRIETQKPTLSKPVESNIEGEPAAEKTMPAEEETPSVVVEKPAAEKEPMDEGAAPGILPPPPKPAPMGRAIVRTLEDDGRFTTLLKVTTEAGLLEELDAPGPFTIFAPTDEAFAKLDPEFLKKLLAAPESLRKVLQHHALTEGLLITDAIAQGKVPTATGLEVQIQKDGDQVLVDQAKVIQDDVKCTNGVVHVIDAVLIPPGFEIPPADSEGEPTATPPAPAPMKKKPVAPSP